MSIESVMLSNHLILHYPLLLLPSIYPSIGVFSNESTLHIRWPRYWSFSFSFSICSSSEYSGLISFRIDWFDLLAVQGTLKSLLWDHSLKASILQHSALHSYRFLQFLQLPTPGFWPEEFHWQYSPWGHKESDTTEWLSLSLFTAFFMVELSHPYMTTGKAIALTI